LESPHGAQPARLSDERKSIVETVESLLDLLPDLGGAIAETVPLEEVDRGEGGGTRNGVPGVRSAETAHLRAVHDLGESRDGADRESAAERLGGREKVGL